MEYGRLGNNLFQIAATIGMGIKFDKKPVFGKWPYNEYMENPLKSYKRLKFTTVCESAFHYEKEYWEVNIPKYDNVVLYHWLQSEKYFEDYKQEIRKQFTIKKEYTTKWLRKFPNKQTIAISIRLGKDYKDNGNYELLPIDYYLNTLEHHFPSWREDYNVIVLSDEIEICRRNIIGDFTFIDGIDIEQLYVMSTADHFILANSTFSWWGAWLGEKPHSKIIYPNKYFKGYLLQTCDIKDFWPERWIKESPL